MTAATAISPSVTFGGQTGSIALSLLDTNFTQIATFLNSTNNFSNYLTDTGAANAIVVTTPTSVTATYTAGLMLVVKVVAANTGATTINVNSLGLKNVTYPSTSALSANALLTGSLALVVYDGTQFILLGAANLGYVTLTGTETLTNKTLTAPVITNTLVTGIRETSTVSATAATGTINFDTLTQVVLYYTTNASGNFTVNFRGNSGTSLDTVMSTGQSLSATFLVTNGSTAYYNSAVTIDGNSVTPKWQGGTAPTSGNASSVDSYTYVILKTGSATFTVLASVTKFA